MRIAIYVAWQLLLALVTAATAFDIKSHQDLSSLSPSQIEDLAESTRSAVNTIQAVSMSAKVIDMADRMRGALWGMHIGDALAMPVHWYYDLGQLKRDFGSINNYEAPPEKLRGSIMSLSNTGGGGRGSNKDSIIGDVIMHGKKKYWERGGNYHYHRGMKAGENTLELIISRKVFMESITASGGQLNSADIIDRYVTLMTTPGSHNDTYAGTCHRMFFANRENGLPLDKCPDNDGHNVDTIDGLVNLTPIVISNLGKGKDAVESSVKESLALFRKSAVLPQFGTLYASMLSSVLSGADLRETLVAGGRAMQVDVAASAGRSDPMTAWYLSSSFPALLHYGYKYTGFEEALLASTNAGGENVARGATLGALLGAHVGMAGLPPHLISGLADSDEISRDIERFMAAAVAAEVEPERETKSDL